MRNYSRTRLRKKPSKRSQAQNESQSTPLRRKTPAITRRALEKSGFPACLDREIEELNKTERLLASQFPEVFG